MLTQKLSITVTTVLLLCTLACNKNNINNTTSVIDTSIAKQLEGDYTESIRKTKTHQYPYQADDSLFTRQITLKKHTDTSLYMYGSYIADSMLIVIPNKDSTSFVADSNNSVVFVYTSITKGSVFPGQLTADKTIIEYEYLENAWPALLTLHVSLEKEKP